MKNYFSKFNIANKILVISVLLIIVSILFLGFGRSYGKKLIFLDGNELYYTSHVTKAEAEALGNYLVKEGTYQSGKKSHVQLDKNNGNYQVRLIIKPGLEYDNETIKILKNLCAGLSQNVFNNEEVDIIICGSRFKTIRTVVAF